MRLDARVPSIFTRWNFGVVVGVTTPTRISWAPVDTCSTVQTFPSKSHDGVESTGTTALMGPAYRVWVLSGLRVTPATRSGPLLPTSRGATTADTNRGRAPGAAVPVPFVAVGSGSGGESNGAPFANRGTPA